MNFNEKNIFLYQYLVKKYFTYVFKSLNNEKHDCFLIQGLILHT